MSKFDFQKISKDVLESIGGMNNIDKVTHCVTRLRLFVKDIKLSQKEKIDNIDGTKGVIIKDNQIHIIFGTGIVEEVYKAFMQELNTNTNTNSSSQIFQIEKKKEGDIDYKSIKSVFKAISDIFINIIPAIVGCAMLLGIKSVLVTGNFLGFESSLADNYVWAADLASFLGIVATGLVFLPVLVCYSATKRFGGSPVYGIVIGLILVHPSLVDRFAYLQGTVEDLQYWNFLPIAIPQVAFQGAIFPAILTGIFISIFEKFVIKHSPKAISFIFVPLVTIFISALALFVVFGPVGDFIATILGHISEFLYVKAGIFGAFAFAALLQPLVITGTQHIIGSIEAMLIATTGYNYIQGMWATSIIAQGGAAIGMFLLAAKHQTKFKEIAVSSFAPTLVGISEPAIFAVNIKYSIYPFLYGTLGAGLGGVYMRLLDVKALGFGLTGIPGITIVNPPVMIHYVFGNLVAFTMPIIFLFIHHKMFKPIAGIEKKGEKNVV